MTTDPARNTADALDDLLQVQRANRAETLRADTDDDDQTAAALAAGILATGPEGTGPEGTEPGA